MKFTKLTVIEFLLIFLVLIPFSLALDKGALIIGDGIIGDGTPQDPYRWDQAPFGVLENCQLQVFVDGGWRPFTPPINIVGLGTSNDPYKFENEVRGLVCGERKVYNLFWDGTKWTANSQQAYRGTTGVMAPLLPSAIVDSCNTSTCKEINNVWLRVSPLLSGLEYIYKGKIWDSGGWTVGVQEEKPVGSQPSAPSLAASNIKQKIVVAALDEEAKWQGKTETDPDMHPLLESYYRAGRCNSWSTTPATAWSGAFISYILKIAVPTFNGECEHVRYFDNVRTSPSICKTYPITQIFQIQPGDVLCKCRDNSGGNNCLINYDGQYTSQLSHCDIVVGKKNKVIEIIGGNLGNTVKRNTISLDIVNNPPNFGFISCG